MACAPQTGLAAAPDLGGNRRMTTNELLAHRVTELEADIAVLQRKVDRLVWALVTLSLSIAGSAIVFALTVVSIRKGS